MNKTYQTTNGDEWREYDLALWFTPEAIREHFEGSNPLDGISDSELVDIAASVLNGDELYKVFDRVLVGALRDGHPELGDEL
jgi:hypothetical protein